MPNLEMDAIEVQHAPMLLQRTLTPSFELLRQGLIQAADGAGAGRHSHQRLGDLAHFLCTGPCHKHLCQSFLRAGFLPSPLAWPGESPPVDTDERSPASMARLRE